MKQPFVLIIEDDPAIGNIFQKTMQQVGFETAIDPEGNRYQRIISDRMPAVVILDLHLPYASGRDILDDLRSNARTSKIPVWVVTADLYFAKELQAENETVLLKPVSPARLMALAQDIKTHYT